MKPVRNSAKAIIIQNEQLLLTKNKDAEGFFYLFPGGGQEKGEELKDSVIRECIEEIGTEVEVNDLVFVREYIGKNHQFAEWDQDIHQVEFYFQCQLINREAVVENGINPDENQVGVEWVDIHQLHEIRIYPDKLAKKIQEGSNSPCYIGDSN